MKVFIALATKANVLLTPTFDLLLRNEEKVRITLTKLHFCRLICIIAIVSGPSGAHQVGGNSLDQLLAPLLELQVIIRLPEQY